MNGSHWSLPGAGRMAAPRGSRGCPEEGVELCSITPHHPLGLPAGALLSGAKERLIAVRRSVADQSGKGRETMSRGNKPCNLFSPPPPLPPPWPGPCTMRGLPVDPRSPCLPAWYPQGSHSPHVPLSSTLTIFPLLSIQSPCILPIPSWACAQLAYARPICIPILLTTLIGSGLTT